MTNPVKVPIPVEELEGATLRFAGDLGDGMQLVGSQFTSASAHLGNHIFTLPEFPTEIRAPAGTLAGVVSFQVHISRKPIHTAGDALDTLVAMNPAALKANLADLIPGGILILNGDRFTPEGCTLAGYAANPLEDGSLANYCVFVVPLHQVNRDAVARFLLASQEIDRCSSFFILGLACRLYERPLERIIDFIKDKYAKNPVVMEASTRTLKAGNHYPEKAGLFNTFYRVGRAGHAAGRYRRLEGKDALVMGFATAAETAKHPLVFAGFPSNPTGELLQKFSELRHRDIRALQAEDEAGALGMVIGGAFGGAIGVTATSGPGLCMKSEALGLAVMAEVPCVILDLQRAGPSNGMPSKTEQGDLFLALLGRNGDSPVIVLAPSSPADCFTMAYEAVRLAIRAMAPVIILSDLYLLQAAELWRVPALASLPPLDVQHPGPHGSNLSRDSQGVRPWALPGTAGLEHRLSGLEKDMNTGDIDYDPANHERMTTLRRQKIDALAQDIPLLDVHGPAQGDLLVLGWGSTEGAIRTAVEKMQARGVDIAWAQLRYLNPMPANTADVLKRYRRIVVPELNSGQLHWLLRAKFFVDSIPVAKVQGRPFSIGEIEEALEKIRIS